MTRKLKIKSKLSFNITSAAFIFCFLFILAGSLVSLHRFWQYEVFYYDFGIFDSVIWSVSRFQPPIIDHLAVGEKLIFADHFYPSIFLLSPLYWLTDKSEVLLIVQAVAVGLSGLILYLMANDILKNKLVSLSLMLCYFLFTGLQNAVITDFHEVTVSVLFFMLSFYFLNKEKLLPFLISFLLFLGFKESNFMVGTGIGIAIFFIKPKFRRTALLTIMLSLLWGILSIKFIIPYFSGGRYVYSEMPVSINPVEIGYSFINNPTKVRTLFYSFLSFGFLPLLSPAFYILIMQDLYVRFFPPNMFLRWDLGLHYSALLAAIFGVSSVYGFRFIIARFRAKNVHNIIAIVLILNALILYRFVLRGPFGLAYNPAFYRHTKDFSFLDEAVKKIPKDASVMAQNNLATRFTHQKVWLLQSDEKKYGNEYYTFKKPDYIIFDKRQGQNPNNYFTVKDLTVLLSNLQKDPNYKLFYKNGDVYIFQKII